MKRCPKCRFELDPVDLKANSCPVCGTVLDPRRAHTKDVRRKLTKDERVKRPL